MKVIDLLNKIANGEKLPKVIKKQWKYEWQYDECREEYTYMQETGERFDEEWLVINMLNDEVEIIEDKNIEKLEPLQKEWMSLDDIKFTFSNSEMIIVNKLNEIIDRLNEGDKQ